MLGGEGVCSVSGLLSVKFNLQLFWREKKGRERQKKRVQSRQKEKIIFFTKRKKKNEHCRLTFQSTEKQVSLVSSVLFACLVHIFKRHSVAGIYWFELEFVRLTHRLVEEETTT